MISLTIQQIIEVFYLGYCSNQLSEDDWNTLKKSFCNKIDISIEEAKKELQEKVCLKISKMKPSVVVLHSSGIDSTFLLLMARRVFEDKNIEIVSVGYTLNDIKYDESRLSAEICQELGCLNKWHTTVVTPEHVKEVLDKINEETYASWFYSSSLVPTYYAVKKAKEYGNSILTGDGGDELFCGYDRYLFANYFGRMIDLLSPIQLPRWSKNERLSKINRYFLSGYEGTVCVWDFLDVFHLFPSLLDGEEIAFDLFAFDLFDRRFEEVSSLSGINYLDKLMLFDIGTELFGREQQKVETACRMAGIDSSSICSPFMSTKIMNWCASLPISYKCRWGLRRKYLLKTVIDNYLSEYRKIVSGKKKGFAVPIGKWFRENDELRSLFYDDSEKKLVKRVITEHMQSKRDHSERLWSMLIYYELSRKGCIQAKKGS